MKQNKLLCTVTDVDVAHLITHRMVHIVTDYFSGLSYSESEV